MSRMLYKLYETDYAQRAPTQAGRTVFSPGKLHVNNSEAGLRMDFHIPVGNPAIEDALRDNMHHNVWMEPQTSVIQDNYPTPVISDSIVEIVKEVGIEGTHEKDETVRVDIHRYEKSIGGVSFEAPE